MKRTPLKRKAPLSRGTKPLKRGKGLAPVSAKGLARREKRAELLAAYFERHGFQTPEGLRAPCQACGDPMAPAACHPHHKTPRSQGGPDTPENLVALHPTCHLIFVHDGVMGLPVTAWGRDRFETCKASPANLLNGQVISWSPQQALELANHRRGGR